MEHYHTTSMRWNISREVEFSRTGLFLNGGERANEQLLCLKLAKIEGERGERRGGGRG